jgi:hypothetical protein
MVRKHEPRLRAGQWVEVRSKEDILRTLDRRAELDSLPFMPEMFQYCGRRFRVFKRAHKTCDPPNGMGARKMANAVHLTGLRCDGAAHGGCQAGCLIFWKEAWLKPVDDRQCFDGGLVPSDADDPGATDVCTEEDVLSAVAPGGKPDSVDPTYVCQSIRLCPATQPLRWWDLGQYIEDFTSGNVRLRQMLAAFLFFLYHELATSGLGIGAALRWLYDQFQRARGGTPYPWRRGKIPRGQPTPAATLGLEKGELVRVKSYREILETVDDERWRNRGLYFDAEAVPYCSGTFRVLRRVQRILDERTGKLIQFKSDALILDQVWCQARYARCRRFCPRSIYAYWREIWLERICEPRSDSAEKC